MTSDLPLEEAARLRALPVDDAIRYWDAAE